MTITFLWKDKVQIPRNMHGEMTNAYETVVGILNGNIHLEELGIDMRIKLKCVLMK
jgi:hypothetical protein